MNHQSTIRKARKQAFKAASEAARKRLDLPTLATRGRDALDFHDISVASLRDAITEVFNLAFEAGARVGYDAGFDDGADAARLLTPVPARRGQR